MVFHFGLSIFMIYYDFIINHIPYDALLYTLYGLDIYLDL